MRRHAVAVLLVVGAVAGVGGCGLPEDQRPHLVTAEDAPLDLTPTESAADTVPEAGEVTVEVFFLNLDQTQLRRARRPVDEVDVAAAIEALLQGPTEEERDELSHAIPPAVELLSAVVADDGLVTLDLAPAGEGGILSVQSDAQARAFAQLVYTATAVPGVERVRFLVEGQPVDAPNDEAALAEVTEADYASLSPSGG